MIATGKPLLSTAPSKKVGDALSTKVKQQKVENRKMLNHLMILNTYKELLDNIDLTTAASEFVRNSEHHHQIFGHFTK